MPVKKQPTRRWNPYVRPAIVIGAFAATALIGAVTGVLLAYSPDLPQISELDSYSPGTITRLYARGGELIGEFATERRVMIGYDEIPEVLRNAIISAEDGDFFTHTGFNIPRFAVTLVRNIMKGDIRAAGGSTITMQLARQVTLSTGRLGTEKRFERKLREIYYAFHIEKRYTKREILTFYANQMYLGTARHSAHGVEAASRLYFGKPATDLTVAEAATIAGMFQTPARQSPLVNMELARVRRNYALGRMAVEGYITQAEADAAKAEPIVLAPRDGPQQYGRTVLHRRSAAASGGGIRCQPAVRTGADRAHHAGRPTAGRRRPGRQRWIARSRQAVRLPCAGAQHPGRGR